MYKYLQEDECWFINANERFSTSSSSFKTPFGLSVRVSKEMSEVYIGPYLNIYDGAFLLKVVNCFRKSAPL